MPNKDNLKIAVASGKGGTGKTTIAVNLAAAIGEAGVDTTYIDCDVEEPNGHIFVKPEIDTRHDVNTLIPEVDLEKCTFCGECAEICEYNALAVLPDKVMVFPELCHSCGGCFHICPEKAITEVPRKIGCINSGKGENVGFIEGRLNIGEVLSPAVTKETKKSAPEGETIIIDAPPGTSCPVIEAVQDSNFVLLVSEPTPFGLNDLKLAVEMIRLLGLPFGVIVNRSDSGDDRTEEYCNKEEIDILLRIKEDRQIAEGYSRGEMAIASNPDLKKSMVQLYHKIRDRVQR